jgi:hypothetical protein
MDIKIITGLIGSAIAIGSLFVFQGQLINRVENLESKSAPDINPIVQEISENKKNIAVLRKDIEQLREKNSNPLLR